MPMPLSGPGVGLLLPQNLYPTELFNSPYDFATNKIALAPGQALPIPAGDWTLQLGFYLVLQYLDPVTMQWSFSSSSSYNRGQVFVKSDGFNYRVANLTGCPVAGVITAPGNGAYVQASTTIAVTGGGGSTWLPVVGGALGYNSVISSGAGYGVAPLVFFPAPPPAAQNSNGVGGVPASGFCTIASGTISGFSFTNVGAGYSALPAPVILPNPTDPNLLAGAMPTAGSLSFSLVATGSLTAAFCTNSGAPLAAVNGITLAVSGVGAAATVSPMCMQTVTGATANLTGSVGFGSGPALVTTVGGVPQTGSVVNPDKALIAWLPRPAQIGFTTATGSISVAAGTIYDGGLFVTNTAGIPTAVMALQPPALGTTLGLPFNSGTVGLTMGSAYDVLTIQPAP